MTLGESSHRWSRGGGVIGKVLKGIFGRKPSKKSRKASRKRSKDTRSKESDDSLSSDSVERLTKQTEKLIAAIHDQVLPLLETESEDSPDIISKNRVLFALNRAAQRALKRRDVFGDLEQLRAEENEADRVVADFLEKETGRDSTRIQSSSIASKCASCGAPCQKCVGSGNYFRIIEICATRCTRGSSASRDGEPRSSVSWGISEVMDFEMSNDENSAAGFYPDPDSDSDEDSDKDAPRRHPETSGSMEDTKTATHNQVNLRKNQ
ncbi:uncharacterized protein LOC108863764 [Galendromus occidentalis]|uniref:Uncharacterized protein LOC108863764 n=1 Tax=Galendromus occidentalis TaxID=34638 RepID=A0AAJ7SD16_9ACAR|nr:uncharacterized protein LOC108863764 [Galendromus occidentalis]